MPPSGSGAALRPSRDAGSRPAGVDENDLRPAPPDGRTRGSFLTSGLAAEDNFLRSSDGGEVGVGGALTVFLRKPLLVEPDLGPRELQGMFGGQLGPFPVTNTLECRRRLAQRALLTCAARSGGRRGNYLLLGSVRGNKEGRNGQLGLSGRIYAVPGPACVVRGSDWAGAG